MNTFETLRKGFRLVLALPLAATLLLVGVSAGAADKSDSDAPDVAAADWHQILPTLRVGGSLRLRAEDQQNFRFGSGAAGDDESYLVQQLRANLTWTPTESMTFFVEGQDARIRQENSINDEAIPNLFADHFDLHQAYMDYRSSLANTPYMVRVGRQQLDFDNGRLVSGLEWENVARVFDGVRLSLGNEKDRTLDMFYTRAVAVRPGNFDDWEKTFSATRPLATTRYADSDFIGMYYSDWKLLSALMPDTRMNAYLYLRDSDEANDRLWTLGTSAATTWNDWDADFDMAYQTGDFGRIDHTAWMMHFGVGYQPVWVADSRIGLAYNWATGDGNATDTDHDTFDSLFPSSHDHYGMMNMFSLQNIHNLELSWDMKVLEGAVRVAFQQYWLDEEDTDSLYDAYLIAQRTAGAAGADTHAGSEFDITFRYPFWNERVVAMVGYAHFFPGSYIDDTGVNRAKANYAFVQADLKF